jgi:hypothetical protein
MIYFVTGKFKMSPNKKLSKFVSDYANYQFESSIEKTKEFKTFATKFKNVIKSILEETNPNFILDSFNIGHFCVSGFIKNQDNNKFVYFSIYDVRCSNDVLDCILVRTAENNKDFTGGNNCYTELENLKFELERLLN